MPPFVVLSGICRWYPRPGGAVRAVDGVDLSIERGEFLAVRGPSGSGKSTLLHLLALLDTPSAGRYRLADEDVAGLPDAERTRRRNRVIGLVFQAFHLIPHLTVLENVELPLAYAGVEPLARRRRAAEVLGGLGLAGRLEHRPEELSGGEQQRTALARALVVEPALLLADEPTGNLDEHSAAAVLAQLRAAHQRGTTVVLVTHDARIASAASRCVAMQQGRLATEAAA